MVFDPESALLRPENAQNGVELQCVIMGLCWTDPDLVYVGAVNAAVTPATRQYVTELRENGLTCGP